MKKNITLCNGNLRVIIEKGKVVSLASVTPILTQDFNSKQDVKIGSFITTLIVNVFEKCLQVESNTFEFIVFT